MRRYNLFFVLLLVLAITTLHAQSPSVTGTVSLKGTASTKGNGAAPIAPTPSCSPGGGTYSSTQTVTCSDAAPVMCYTEDGSIPQTNGTSGCTSGTKYTSSLTVAFSLTLTVIAGGTGYGDSVLLTNVYLINTGNAPLTYTARTDMCAESITDCTLGYNYPSCTGTGNTTCSAYSGSGSHANQVLNFRGAGTTAANYVWTPASTNGIAALPSPVSRSGNTLTCPADATAITNNGCGGSSVAVKDPDFGTTMWRVTDFCNWGTGGSNCPGGSANLDYGKSFQVGDNGGFSVWDLNSLAVIVFQSNGGASLASCPGCGNPSDTNGYFYPSGVGGSGAQGGTSTTFASNEIAFSGTYNDVIYEMDHRTKCGAADSQCSSECAAGAGQCTNTPFNQLNKVVVNRNSGTQAWTLTRTPLMNFSNGWSNTCLITPGSAPIHPGSGLSASFVTNWAGAIGITNGDTSFTFAFSDNDQGGIAKGTKQGAVFVVNWTIGQGCRILYTAPNSNSKMSVVSADWGTLPGDVCLGPFSGCTNTYNDNMYLHAASPTPIASYAGVTPGKSVTTCPHGGCTTFACYGVTTSGNCENYFWNTGTNILDFTTITGHSAQGNLYQYKGKALTAFSYLTPEVTAGTLLPTTAPYQPPVDQHQAYWNADLNDSQPVFTYTTNVCGLGPNSTVASNNCNTPTQTDPSIGIGLFDYSNICALLGNSPPQCPLVNEIMASENFVTGHHSCNYGSGANSAACEYRMSHSFGSGSNWYFNPQNMVGNPSPNGIWSLVSTDWFAGVGWWPFGCTNGATTCFDNITANGANTQTISGIVETGTTGNYTETFTVTPGMSGYSPTTFSSTIGNSITVAGSSVAGYITPWIITGGTATTFTATYTGSTGLLGCSMNCGTATFPFCSSVQNINACPRADLVLMKLTTAN